MYTLKEEEEEEEIKLINLDGESNQKKKIWMPVGVGQMHTRIMLSLPTMFCRHNFKITMQRNGFISSKRCNFFIKKKQFQKESSP